MFKVVLAEPRGFCAGVDRAIEIVERALEKFGPPIYVRHEIVHNRHVVEKLRAKGAVFVEELRDVPNGAVVIFSAHGVSRAVVEEAGARRGRGRHIVLIGHAGHPEVEGTLGQVPLGTMTLVETVEDVEKLDLDPTHEISYVTQTTLSMDDTKQIVAALRRKYPSIEEPKQEDICYATQNRQNAVKSLVETCDVILVLGAPNSSNSNRLVEVARQAGARSYLLQSAKDLDPKWLEGARAVGVTAGASAPEELVRELVRALEAKGARGIETLKVAEERVQFSLPRELAAP